MLSCRPGGLAMSKTNIDSPQVAGKLVATEDDYKRGPFGALFAWLGLFAGGAMGAETERGPTIVICAIITAVIGFYIGRLSDALTAWLTFIFVAVVELLVNDSVRQAVLGVFN